MVQQHRPEFDRKTDPNAGGARRGWRGGARAATRRCSKLLGDVRSAVRGSKHSLVSTGRSLFANGERMGSPDALFVAAPFGFSFRRIIELIGARPCWLFCTWRSIVGETFCVEWAPYSYRCGQRIFCYFLTSYSLCFWFLYLSVLFVFLF